MGGRAFGLRLPPSALAGTSVVVALPVLSAATSGRLSHSTSCTLGTRPSTPPEPLAECSGEHSPEQSLPEQSPEQSHELGRLAERFMGECSGDWVVDESH